jgi:hypothetical protein
MWEQRAANDKLATMTSAQCGRTVEWKPWGLVQVLVILIYAYINRQLMERMAMHKLVATVRLRRRVLEIIASLLSPHVIPKLKKRAVRASQLPIFSFAEKHESVIILCTPTLWASRASVRGRARVRFSSGLNPLQRPRRPLPRVSDDQDRDDRRRILVLARAGGERGAFRRSQDDALCQCHATRGQGHQIRRRGAGGAHRHPRAAHAGWYCGQPASPLPPLWAARQARRHEQSGAPDAAFVSDTFRRLLLQPEDAPEAGCPSRLMSFDSNAGCPSRLMSCESTMGGDFHSDASTAPFWVSLREMNESFLGIWSSAKSGSWNVKKWRGVPQTPQAFLSTDEIPDEIGPVVLNCEENDASGEAIRLVRRQAVDDEAALRDLDPAVASVLNPCWVAHALFRTRPVEHTRSRSVEEERGEAEFYHKDLSACRVPGAL